MAELTILTLARLGAEDRAKIEAVEPAVRLIDAGGWFDGEYRETWPSFAAERYLAPDANGHGTRAERDRLLAEAEIVIGGWPFPLDLRARAPRLKWFHQRPAGASNLLRGDLWRSDVTITTSRGSANALAIAEFAVAGTLHLAKGLPRAAIDRDVGVLSARSYRPLLLTGKTACVVGAGGIGQQVGRLCAALGMRVVGTRRHKPPDLPPGFSEIGAAGDLGRFLSVSDVVFICCQWTPETDRLFNQDRFAAMKPEQHPGQRRAGRDRGRGCPRGRARPQPSAGRRSRRLRWGIRTPAARAVVVGSPGDDHAAYFRPERSGPARRGRPVLSKFACLAGPASDAQRGRLGAGILVPRNRPVRSTTPRLWHHPSRALRLCGGTFILSRHHCCRLRQFRIFHH